MTELAPRCVGDYPILEACGSDLRQCSKDDSDPGNTVYMYGERGVYAIDFDNVMRCFSNDQQVAGVVGSMGIARSADALYVGDDKTEWDATLAFVEFKNGNLFERKHATMSKRDRRELNENLEKAIDEALEREAPMETVGWERYLSLEESLKKSVARCVNERLNERDRGARGASRSRRQGDSYRLETIKTKAAFSALLLSKILDVSASYIKDHVDFILVYNDDCNPGPGEDPGAVDDNFIPRSPSTARMQKMIAWQAKRPLRRFGLKEALGCFFHDVITCTAGELNACLGRQ